MTSCLQKDGSMILWPHYISYIVIKRDKEESKTKLRDVIFRDIQKLIYHLVFAD